MPDHIDPKSPSKNNVSIFPSKINSLWSSSPPENSWRVKAPPLSIGRKNPCIRSVPVILKSTSRFNRVAIWPTSFAPLSLKATAVLQSPNILNPGKIRFFSPKLVWPLSNGPAL